MKQMLRTIAAITAMLVLLAGASLGQQKKSYTFHGKIEGVDEKAKMLKVNGEEVKGWMGAMTMDYAVDDATVLKKVKVGDQITATVYDGDYTLHKVEVVPKSSK